MFKVIGILLVGVVSVNCRVWGDRACLVNGNGFYVKTIQESIRRMEKDIKWCNFKLVDVSKEIDEKLFKWHAVGTANYTNGFLLSFQKLDISNARISFYTTLNNGTEEYRMMAAGTVNFRNLKVGYNVEAHMEDSGAHYFTGIFPYTTVSITCTIVKNPLTNEVDVTTSSSSSPASRRMEILPRNSVSEVLSRHIATSDIAPSFNLWAQDIFAPMVEKVAVDIGMPDMRFDNKC